MERRGRGGRGEGYVSTVTPLKVTEMPGHAAQRGESNHATPAPRSTRRVYDVTQTHTRSPDRRDGARQLRVIALLRENPSLSAFASLTAARVIKGVKVER